MALGEQYGQRVVFSESPGQAEALALQAAREGDPLIVAAGGDETVREVLRGMFAPESPLKFGSPPGSFFGVLPLGTFNNFANYLGVPADLQQALHAFHHGRESWVDLGRVNGKVFTESIGVGIDVAAWKAFPPEPPTLAERLMSGSVAVIQALARYKPHRFILRADGHERRLRAYSVTVANTQQFSSAWTVAPHAVRDDGKLDLVVIPAISRARFIAALPLIFWGKHTSFLREVQYHHVKEVTITAHKPYPVRVDGALSLRLPVNVQVIPKAVPVRLIS